MIGMNDATRAQVRAADPKECTWVSANAGSGKTRVLTDRVARLLIHGANPARILCLTYTKAAASEMQNRLFERLGAWSMLDDKDLRDRLVQLGEEQAGLDEKRLRRIRTLFASALETPGGLKIQTIHSFCDAILRRFPLEARVSPRFQVLDERQAELMQADVLEGLAKDQPQVFNAFAKRWSQSDTGKLAGGILKVKASVAVGPEPESFDLHTGDNFEALAAFVLPVADRQKLEAALPLIGAYENASMVSGKAKIEAALNANTPNAVLDHLHSAFLFAGGKTPGAPNGFPISGFQKANPEVMAWLSPLKERAAESLQKYRNLISYDRACAFNDFADAFLERYEARKADTALLDYDDLIERCAKLFATKGLAEWVLYRLDGGIDHVLVDEAQDTSPAQWEIIQKLTEEITSGEGARPDAERTIFVVGDEKQSIYSFQGARPETFQNMKANFGDALKTVGRRLEESELVFSFRSAQPVLSLVDRTISGTHMQTVKDHAAFFGDMPGRIDLWPLMNKPEEPDKGEWFEPLDQPSPDSLKTVLAGEIAHFVKQTIDSETVLQSGSSTGGSRKVHAGDFLILLQRRDGFFHNLIAELKNAGIDVAGADRISLNEELAVKDIVSLLKFLATPDDDLSLAEALRSPLFGLSEGAVFQLAHARPSVLWMELRAQQETYPEANNILSKLLDRVGLHRPYELIEAVLTEFNGRQRLRARLGDEVEDALDELLTQSLHYEQLEPPSLIGFLDWFTTSNIDIKREIGGGQRQVRVMTVHGAKGLEAPIVILPDTYRDTAPAGDQFLANPDGPVLWPANGNKKSPRETDLLDAAKEKARQENERLLYVAMTRAENWLVVCSHVAADTLANKKSPPWSNWYSRISAAMEHESVAEHEFGKLGMGLRLQNAGWDADWVDGGSDNKPESAQLPDWLSRPAEALPRPLQPRSPSGLPGAKILPGPVDPELSETAKTRGTALHLLLEKLPNVQPADWDAYAQRLTEPFDFEIAVQQALIEKATSILGDPSLSDVFGQSGLSEVTVTSPFVSPDGRPILGAIDRLIVASNRVHIVDFKSNQRVPDRVEDTPLGILNQMAAYVYAVSKIYPDFEIQASILWTENARIMSIPHEIVKERLIALQHLDPDKVPT